RETPVTAIHSLALHDALPIYWKGLGVPVDRPIGYAWMDLAAERMYPNFTILRERYWGDLSPAERDDAIRRGQALLAEFGDEVARSEEHTSELQSRENLVCRLL